MDYSGYNEGKLLIIDVEKVKFHESKQNLGIIIDKINAELFGLFTMNFVELYPHVMSLRFLRKPLAVIAGKPMIQGFLTQQKQIVE